MPYGISKKIGGDTPANDARMERCVQDVMRSGKSKLSAILICKASIQRKGK
jgi:hypothetical protein